MITPENVEPKPADLEKARADVARWSRHGLVGVLAARGESLVRELAAGNTAGAAADARRISALCAVRDEARAPAQGAAA